MKKEKSPPVINHAPEDYTFAIIKEFRKKSNAERFIERIDVDDSFRETREYEIAYKVSLIEFGISFHVDSLVDIEQVVLNRIASEIKIIRDKNPKKVPVPLRLTDKYTGKLSLRISPHLHKQLHVEAFITETTINNLIEKKLSNES